MCFYSDPDWYSSQTTDTTGTATAEEKCCECYGRIKVGEVRRHLSMREREDGGYCEPEDGHHVDGCDGTDCEYIGPGETWEGSICTDCQTLRDAIRQVEEDAGCRGAETEPSYGGLFDEVGSSDDGWIHYFDEFVRLGLWEAVRVMPEIDWEDYLDYMAYEGLHPSRWIKPRGPYAGAVCEVTYGDPVEWFELGGEG